MVEYDLVDHGLDIQNVLQCVFVNDLWRVKKDVVDVALRGNFSDQRPDDGPLFFDEPPVLRMCQNWQCWGAIFGEVVFIQRICQGASGHEMFLVMLMVWDGFCG